MYPRWNVRPCRRGLKPIARRRRTQGWRKQGYPWGSLGILAHVIGWAGGSSRFSCRAMALHGLL
eukprot:2863614-Pyramimonas_sp.AAC.1